MFEIVEDLKRFATLIPDSAGKTQWLECAKKQTSWHCGEAVYRLLFYGKRAENLPSEVIEAGVRLLIQSQSLKFLHRILRLDADTNHYFQLAPILRREIIEILVFSKEPAWHYWLFNLLAEIPNLPEDLLKKGLERNHINFPASVKAVDVMDFFLPRWLVRKGCGRYQHRVLYSSLSGILVFQNHIAREWELFEKTSKGALIGWSATEYGREAEKVVLLPDVSYPEKGYAIRVDQEVETVHQAIAWMYRRDPKKFNGFTTEV